jgi:hypothetical protein
MNVPVARHGESAVRIANYTTIEAGAAPFRRPPSSKQAVEKLYGRTNSYHQDSFQYLLFNTRSTGALEGCTKAPRKTHKDSRFSFAFLGVLVPWWLSFRIFSLYSRRSLAISTTC